jgi:hypothetical protein
MKKISLAALIALVSTVSLSADSWYIVDKKGDKFQCFDTKEANVNNPNSLIVSGCKPLVGGEYDDLSQKGVLMYDCKGTKIDALVVMAYGTKSGCEALFNGGNTSNQDNTQNTQQDESKYKFIGIDDLEAFPSDYIGKKLYLRCKRSNVSEDREGGYSIMATCANADGDYGFGSNNPFKIKIHTNSKDDAKNIAKSKKKEKFLLGTVRKDQNKYAVSKYIFEISEVQF